MKKKFRVGVYVLVISLCLPLAKLNATSGLPLSDLGLTVSMDFRDTNLKDVLKAFSIQAGLGFIASEAVQDRKITLYLDSVPLDKALDELFKANNLSYELDKDAGIFIVKEWGKPGVDTITKVFRLKHATVSSSPLMAEMETISESESSSGETTVTSATTGGFSKGSTGGSGKGAAGKGAGITEAVKKHLSENGMVIEDFRTNSLIVTDTPKRMTVINQLIAALDVSVPQIMLEVEMLDVSKNIIDRLGIKFTDVMTSSMFSAIVTGAATSSPFPFLESLYRNRPGYSKDFTNGSVDFSKTAWKLFFDFIRQQADTKVLARPRILTLNNMTAEIKITTQESIGTLSLQQGQGSAASTTTSAERVETGVHLRVTPQINMETGEITMFIYPKVRDASTSATFSSGSATYKDPEERATKSTVRIKDGETVIIGGLIRHDKSETITKLPFLGDLPLIGNFFRHKYKDKDRERELLIFITPHIIKDTDIKLAQTKKSSAPDREQESSSGLSRELEIGSVLNSFEKRRIK